MPTAAPRAKAVFDHAAEIQSPSERAAYLAEACAGHPDVRREVEELLRAHGEAGSFLESGAVAAGPDATVASEDTTEATGAGPAAPPAATHPATAAEPAVVIASTDGHAGAVIAGKYTLAEPIGEGGMGSVWRARQTEPVKRHVAVKLIKAGMDSKQVLARFEAERQALALMDHPNIARVLDGGLYDGRPFFVMELVKGVPITEFCDARRLTPRQRLDLFVPVCQAIQHAHQKGVIHRDIKPSNVLVALYDDRPVPKVIDFGVAKATGAALTERTIDTGFGGIVGTPQYMSPEQATLNNLDIDTRSDVYALGVLLYELLTGSTPFSRKELEKKGMLEILRVVREEEPPRPSTKLSTAEALPTLSANRGTEPRALTGMLRSELDWVVMKALEKDRSRRYETANAFAADVRRYLEGEAVQAHPPGAGYRLRKLVRRHRVQVVAAGLVLLALVAGVVGTSIGLVRATRAASAERAAKLREAERAEGERLAKDEALESAEEERKAKETVEAVLGFVEDRVFAAARPKGQEGGLGYDVKLADAITAALPAIEGGFRDRPLIEARLRRTIAGSFFYLGKPELALGQVQAALALCRRELGPDHPDTLRNMRSVAACYAQLGRDAEALKLMEEVLPLMKAKLGPDHPDTLKAVMNLGGAYMRLGRDAEALKLYEELLPLMKAKLGPDHPDTLSAVMNLGAAYMRLGRAAEAVKIYEESLPLRKAKFGPDHPDTLVMMMSLSGIYMRLGRAAEALKLMEEVLPLMKAKLDPDHLMTLISRTNLADAYAAVGRHAEAKRLHEETLPLQKAKLGLEHTLTLSTMMSLACCEMTAGRTREARALLEEASAASRKHPEESWQVAAVQAWYGFDQDFAASLREILASARGTDDATTALRAAQAGALRPPSDPAARAEALALARRAVELHDGQPERLALGMAEFRSGHLAEADLALRAAGIGPDVTAAGSAAFYRAMALFRQGRKDEARELAAQAAAAMRPLPRDNQGPTGNSNPNNLILWLACKEAKAMIASAVPAAAPATPNRTGVQ